MNVFFDCEFTKLPGSPEGYPGLISIGCVAEDGQRTFYAELNNTWQPGNCSQFVLDTVLPLLQGGECRMADAQCALRLKYWIEELTDEEVILRSDNPAIDWPWVEELFQFFGCWPKNLRRTCGSIHFDQEEQQEFYFRAHEDYWGVPVHSVWRHHALSDAKGLLFAWWHAKAYEMPESEFQELISTLSKWSVQDGDHGYIYWTNVMANLKGLRKLAVATKG